MIDIDPNDDAALVGWRVELIDERQAHDVQFCRGERSRGENLFNVAVHYQSPSGEWERFRGGNYTPCGALAELVGGMIRAGMHVGLLKPGEAARFELVERAQAEARAVLERTLHAKGGSP